MSVPPKTLTGDKREGSVKPDESGRRDAPAPAAAFLPTLDAAGRPRTVKGRASAAAPAHESQTAARPSMISGIGPEALERGTTIGRYLVTERIGAGGMGVVYAAYDPELDRKVAIKLLHTESWISDSTLGRVRLLREAQAMARLSHPNVIAVYDVGTFHEQVFVAMELIDGPTLSDWLTEAPRTRAEILGLFMQAGRGLRAAHAAGLVHRDFKPDKRRSIFSSVILG